MPADTRVLGRLEQITSQLTQMDELNKTKEPLESCACGFQSATSGNMVRYLLCKLDTLKSSMDHNVAALTERQNNLTGLISDLEQKFNQTSTGKTPAFNATAPPRKPSC